MKQQSDNHTICQSDNVCVNVANVKMLPMPILNDQFRQPHLAAPHIIFRYTKRGFVLYGNSTCTYVVCAKFAQPSYFICSLIATSETDKFENLALPLLFPHLFLSLFADYLQLLLQPQRDSDAILLCPSQTPFYPFYMFCTATSSPDLGPIAHAGLHGG